MKKLTLPSKITLALILFLPLFFMVAALGTKIGLWGYEIGLSTMTFGAGMWLVGIVGVVAMIALIIALVRKPRSGLAIGIATLGLIVPAVFAAWGASVSGVASANPIHDVATDTANPPEFSKATMAARKESGANPLNDYQTPLGQLEAFAGSSNELKIRSHAQIITKRYAGLSPLPLAGASQADAIAAVAAAMEDMGFSDITSDEKSGRVEGVAETFWYGFKDDVVARVGDAQIDFRSVSRVGRSDLGANAARIEELRGKVEALLGQR
ncbi:MAG: DUF1499 domain-containing protein [Pseudomonadota bacterium]